MFDATHPTETHPEKRQTSLSPSAEESRSLIPRLASVRFHRLIVPGLLLAISLSIYGTTLAPGILGGDAGEMQFAPAILSLPHPSGYPVQTLLNRLWIESFPVGDVAWRVNLLSAVTAALGTGLVGYAVAQITRSQLAGLAAGLGLAVAPVYWSQAVLGDKYALNGLLTACMLAGTGALFQHRDRRSWLVLMAAGGFAVAHHRSLWLFGPVIGSFALLWGRHLLRYPRIWLWSSLLFSAPLLLYLYLPWAASRPLPPGDAFSMDWSTFFAYVISEGSSGQVTLQPDWPGLQLYGSWLLDSFPLWWLIPGIAGLFFSLRRSASRSWTLFLLIAFLWSAYLSAIYENYDLPRRYVYFVPSYVVLAMLLGQGWAEIWRIMRRGHGSVRKTMGSGGRIKAVVQTGIVLLALAPLLWIPPRWQSFRAAQYHEIPLDIWRQELKSGQQADRLAQALAMVEPGALVVGDWEQATALWYAQQVEGNCPDCRIEYPLHKLYQYTKNLDEHPIYVARTVNDSELWSHPTAVGPLVHLPQRPQTQLPQDIDLRQFSYRDDLVLVGVSWPLGRREAQPGRVLPLSLIWQHQGTDPLPPYALSLRLIGPTGESWKADTPAPVLGMHPFTAFQAGEVVADYYEIPILPGSPPGAYALTLIVYLVEDGLFTNILAAQLDGHPLGEQVEILHFTLP